MGNGDSQIDKIRLKIHKVFGGDGAEFPVLEAGFNMEPPHVLVKCRVLYASLDALVKHLPHIIEGDILWSGGGGYGGGSLLFQFDFHGLGLVQRGDLPHHPLAFHPDLDTIEAFLADGLTAPFTDLGL